jgi:hypothetical protein
MRVVLQIGLWMGLGRMGLRLDGETEGSAVWGQGSTALTIFAGLQG